jgi:hypothetical protein
MGWNLNDLTVTTGAPTAAAQPTGYAFDTHGTLKGGSVPAAFFILEQSQDGMANLGCALFSCFANH